MVDIKIIAHSNSPHLQQIYTGLAMLHRQKKIRLSQNLVYRGPDFTLAPHLVHSHHAHMSILVNGSIKIHYDTHDSVDVLMHDYENCDYYFKRSYRHKDHKEMLKVYPLGLNYRVYPDFIDYRAIERALKLSFNRKQKLKDIVRSINIPNIRQFTARVNIITPGNKTGKGGYDILFMTRTFDPYERRVKTQEWRSAIVAYNDMRAEYILALRNEFGEQFYGGFTHSPVAIKEYKECLLPDDNQYSQKRYLELVRNSKVCVATTGLFDSVGWKFSEYVAMGKAIISEPLQFESPGLRQGIHYLEFKGVKQCIERAHYLINNPEERKLIEAANAKYYFDYLAPDKIIERTLYQARCLQL